MFNYLNINKIQEIKLWIVQVLIISHFLNIKIFKN
jgi:hypothetical protein